MITYISPFTSCRWTKVETEKTMEWFFHKRRGSGIEKPMDWFYTSYKAQLHQITINFQLFLFLLPIVFIFFMASFSTNEGLSFQLPYPQHECNHRAGSFPWGVAILIRGVLLVLVSYQSAFQSKWFGALRSSSLLKKLWYFLYMNIRMSYSSF